MTKACRRPLGRWWASPRSGGGHGVSARGGSLFDSPIWAKEEEHREEEHGEEECGKDEGEKYGE